MKNLSLKLMTKVTRQIINQIHNKKFRNFVRKYKNYSANHNNKKQIQIKWCYHLNKSKRTFNYRKINLPGKNKNYRAQ